MSLSQFRPKTVRSVRFCARAAACLSAAWLTLACSDMFDGSSSSSSSSSSSTSSGGETDRDASAPEAGEIEPPTCVECSEVHQGNCHEFAQKCFDDPACKKMLDCTFPEKSAGCGLDKAGATCTRNCIATQCSDAASIELYLALEQCLYCEERCASPCAAYCEALSPDEPIGPCEAGEGGAGGAAGGSAGVSGGGLGGVGGVPDGGGAGGVGGVSAAPVVGTAGASAGTAGSVVSGPAAGSSGSAGFGGSG